ncbi:MAG TPA: sigma-70 family RNA polymerase sigma factor [Sediminibacterium sp.]|nr:sigma-70 family RNA polymerase sigma factor [Sediminibacterium sp.]
MSDKSRIIKEWVNSYSDRMYSWALHRTNNREVAEDLVQDTFIAAIQSFEKFEGKSEPQTWLLGILNNKIAGYYRKQYRNPVISAGSAGSDGENDFLNTFFNSNGEWQLHERPSAWTDDTANLLDDAAFTTELQKCMDRLPSNWLAAVRLKYLEAQKAETICQELGVAPTNYWQMLHRAKLQLRKCLEVHWFKK